MYYDKNGNPVNVGDFIRFDDGSIEQVFSCGDDDLGIMATNKDYLKYHPDARIEYYPMSQFDYDSFELVK